MIDSAKEAGHPPQRKRDEILAFLILAVVIWPILSVAIVGGYGFLVWMWQIIFGPPGPIH
ncbi:periplasmic nitrate reductase, NapE protein [Paracoccus sp. PS-1]|uniref:periplasmic nitrate reductase, NapE protein n=1 Tax=unclassified Paracoccus (in: a-proteobacteria) TaxID=2688777 RepID=UPI000491FC82|nr:MULTISPECIES: periplasmic nitrate reductase, NapE protein [unclassified Paracoccus (in: a-proteobacteria)]MDQ7261898.1 periplasmic nitrate reductase, NapE protein [Paracoccus sp. PS1]UFM66966.1 periplasmic nitrate reductase, NapE protein [Paracoccus sp. MA]